MLYTPFKANGELATDVRTLGVKGDGVTDDSQAIIAASQNNSILIFPEGTYIIDSYMVIKNIKNLKWIAKGDVVLYDKGKNILLNDGVTFGTSPKGIRFENCPNLEVIGFYHDGYIGANHGIIHIDHETERVPQIDLYKCEKAKINLKLKSLVGSLITTLSLGAAHHMRSYYFRAVDCPHINVYECEIVKGSGRGEFFGFVNCYKGKFLNPKHKQEDSNVTIASLAKFIGSDGFVFSGADVQSNSTSMFVDVCGKNITIEDIKVNYPNGHILDVTSEWSVANVETDNLTIRDIYTTGKGIATNLSDVTNKIDNVYIDNFIIDNQDANASINAFANPLTKNMKISNANLKNIRNLIYARVHDNIVSQKVFTMDNSKLITDIIVPTSSVVLDVVGDVVISNSLIDLMGLNKFIIRDEWARTQGISLAQSHSKTLFNNVVFKNMKIEIGANVVFKDCSFYNCKFYSYSSGMPINPNTLFEDCKIEFVDGLNSITTDGKLFEFLSGEKLTFKNSEIIGITESNVNPIFYYVIVNKIPLEIDGGFIDILRAKSTSELMILSLSNDSSESNIIVKNLKVGANTKLLQTTGNYVSNPTTFNTIKISGCDFERLDAINIGSYNNRIKFFLSSNLFQSPCLSNLKSKESTFKQFIGSGNNEW